jgi:hypothetical protein
MSASCFSTVIVWVSTRHRALAASLLQWWTSPPLSWSLRGVTGRRGLCRVRVSLERQRMSSDCNRLRSR